MTRNTTTRDEHRRTLAIGEPPCGICGEPIDYSLPYTDPRSYVVDHIIPWKVSGDDSIDNKQPAHRSCNRDKGDTVDYQPGVAFVTDRCWWTQPA